MERTVEQFDEVLNAFGMRGRRVTPQELEWLLFRSVALCMAPPGPLSPVTNGQWARSAYGTASAARLSGADTVYSVTPIHHPSGLLMAIGDRMSRYITDVEVEEIMASARGKASKIREAQKRKKKMAKQRVKQKARQQQQTSQQKYP